jgi:hypothetical protein
MAAKPADPAAEAAKPEPVSSTPHTSDRPEAGASAAVRGRLLMPAFVVLAMLLAVAAVWLATPGPHDAEAVADGPPALAAPIPVGDGSGQPAPLLTQSPTAPATSSAAPGPGSGRAGERAPAGTTTRQGNTGSTGRTSTGGSGSSGTTPKSTKTTSPPKTTTARPYLTGSASAFCQGGGTWAFNVSGTLHNASVGYDPHGWVDHGDGTSHGYPISGDGSTHFHGKVPGLNFGEHVLTRSSAEWSLQVYVNGDLLTGDSIRVSGTVYRPSSC